MTWRWPLLQECTEYLAKRDSSKTLVVLRNPFPTQLQQNLITKQLKPSQGGNDGLQHPSASEASSTIYTFEMVELATRAKSYGAPVASVA